MSKFSVTILILMISVVLTSCSTDSYQAKILSMDGRSVEYKIIMDPSYYSPGIIVDYDTDTITFPKCVMKTTCVVTYKSEGGYFNRYRVMIPKDDERTMKMLIKMFIRPEKKK